MEAVNSFCRLQGTRPFLGSLVFGPGVRRADGVDSESEKSLEEVVGAWDPFGCLADEKHAFRIC